MAVALLAGSEAHGLINERVIFKGEETMDEAGGSNYGGIGCVVVYE